MASATPIRYRHLTQFVNIDLFMLQALVSGMMVISD